MKAIEAINKGLIEIANAILYVIRKTVVFFIILFCLSLLVTGIAGLIKVMALFWDSVL